MPKFEAHDIRTANTNTGQPLDGSTATVPAANTIFYGPHYPSAIILFAA